MLQFIGSQSWAWLNWTEAYLRVPQKWNMVRKLLGRWCIYWSLRTDINIENEFDLSALMIMKIWNHLEYTPKKRWVEKSAREYSGLTFKGVGIHQHMDLLDDSWTESFWKCFSKLDMMPRLMDLNCLKDIYFISCKGVKIGIGDNNVPCCCHEMY